MKVIDYFKYIVFQVKYDMQEESLYLWTNYLWKIIQNNIIMFIKDGDSLKNGDFWMILLDFI